MKMFPMTLKVCLQVFLSEKRKIIFDIERPYRNLDYFVKNQYSKSCYRDWTICFFR